DLGTAVLDLHVDLPPRPPHARSVDRLDGPDDDPRQRALGHPHAGSEDLHPTAASSTSSRNDVEYSPLRNRSLPRISWIASRVVGTPSISSSSSARRARAIASSRVESRTITFAIIES